ncbi:MAG: FkbM family methyltransferase [Candidatus Staskawiczbacteria bacterium]|nr:FkbM family methyltransferase [Candidatus Staskawiczbacteria bacterium]
MKRFNLSFLIKIFVYLKYLPFIVFEIKNWQFFLLNYLGIKNGGGVFEFRNGLKIKTKDAVSSATVSVIFIKKDYGEINDNSVIIDIGANIGVFSLYAAQSKNTIIYAFEPLPRNYSLLLENIAFNKLEKNIIPFNLAVGEKEEKRTLYLGESPFPSFLKISDSPFNAHFGSEPYEQNQQSIEINCVALKDVFDKNNIQTCDILKMDCEGAEFEILYSLPEEYYKKIKEIRMEYHNHLSEPRNNINYLLEFLQRKGYEIKKLKKSSIHQGDLWLSK